MKILIIGAGWYGCHCASVLNKYNIKYDITDKQNDIFCGSSSHNQNRLHKGFHYCRSFHTRKECEDGFERFMETYGEFTQPIPKNYYCIDKRSTVDFETYKVIFNKHMFSVTNSMDIPMHITDKFEGIIKTQERFIDYKKIKQHFQNSITLTPNPNPADYDYIIDCTYSTINDNMYYEQCVSLVYKYKHPSPDFAITVVDGPFWSLYPYDPDNSLYTLTDVEFTPQDIAIAKPNMEAKIITYMPDFLDHFEYVSYFRSRKTKLKDAKTDDRSLIWEKKDNTFRFSGGKITGIFAMEDILKKELKLV